MNCLFLYEQIFKIFTFCLFQSCKYLENQIHFIFYWIIIIREKNCNALKYDRLNYELWQTFLKLHLFYPYNYDVINFKWIINLYHKARRFLCGQCVSVFLLHYQQNRYLHALESQVSILVWSPSDFCCSKVQCNEHFSTEQSSSWEFSQIRFGACAAFLSLARFTMYNFPQTASSSSLLSTKWF